MEELQSTEALDKEILEDARKKAFKLLKGADETLASAKTAWQKKLNLAEEKVRKTYAEKESHIRREVTARLPMDKRRIRSVTIDRFLTGAMDDFLRSLDRPSVLRILQRELERRVTDDLRGAAELRYRHLSAEEVRGVVSSLTAGSLNGKFSFTYIEDPLFTIAGSFPALVIDFPRVRITASLDRAAEALLMEKRAELTLALLGEIEDLEKPSGSVLAPASAALPETRRGGGNG